MSADTIEAATETLKQAFPYIDCDDTNDPDWYQEIVETVAPVLAETVALAVESARRWAARTDLSADLRLRRIWQVLTTALEA